MTRRLFNGSEKVALYLSAGGRCSLCQAELQPGWHADHVDPYMNGGATDVVNGQALCPACNLAKGSETSMTLIDGDATDYADDVQDLRVWQREALRLLLRSSDKDFLVVACPGAGKTAFALAAYKELGKVGGIERLVVVVPTKHLRRQWAEAAAGEGVQLDYRFENKAGALARDYDGTVITYQSVAAQPRLWKRHCSAPGTLVILDEIHHCGDEDKLSWGPAVATAFGPAQRRILLSGTPFRSDGHPISFVNYDEDGRSVAGFNYDYGQAIVDGGVVRPIEFLALNGEMTWRNAASVVQATLLLSETSDADLAKALPAALNLDGEWLPSVLRQANDELTRQREEVPNAGGLVVALDQQEAKKCARELRLITGEKPPVAISDDPDASRLISEFTRSSSSRWLVAVNMVSEGVDIPRLSVGVYATNVRAELFFRQLVGRFVRRRFPGDESSSVLLIPSIPPLLKLAAEIEKTVDAALVASVERAGRDADAAGKVLGTPWEMSSSEASRFATVTGFGSFSDEELRRGEELRVANRFLANLTAAQVASVVRQSGVTPTSMATPKPQRALLADQKAIQRGIIARKVGRLNHLTGAEHAHIHADLNRRCGGTVPTSTVEQLDRRIQLLAEWVLAAEQ